MKHTEKELEQIKSDLNNMWKLVLSQLEKSKQALLNADIELAREIISREKRVNAFELKIESDCENFIALYAPVAVDLRLVLSTLKIVSTLERIGDFAESIARYVIEDDCNNFPEQVFVDLKVEETYDILLSMLSDCYIALESENTKIAGRILAKDNAVDTNYLNAYNVLTSYLQDNTSYIRCGLKLMNIIRRLERIGDHTSNIVEDIVFYIDAKVLKHGMAVKSE